MKGKIQAELTAEEVEVLCDFYKDELITDRMNVNAGNAPAMLTEARDRKRRAYFEELLSSF